MSRSFRNRVIPFNDLSGLRIPRSASHPFNRDESKNKDWFTIRNAKDDVTEILIYDEIGFWGTDARTFVKDLMKIETNKIVVRINSPGGEIFDGVAIYNALKMHDAEVDVFVDGLAASAASFIAQAGDTITMREGTTMMIHDGLALCIGNESDMLEAAKVLSTVSNNIAGIYAASAGGTVESWRALMRQEVWFNAQEAVDAGLADEVSKDEEPAKNQWDLSIFNYAGRNAAPSPDEVRELIITNKAKEASVSPKNSGDGGTDSATPPADPPVPAADPPAADPPVVEPASGQEGSEGEPQPTPVTEPVPVGDPPAVVPPTNQAGVPVFKVNGLDEVDPTKIQMHILGLEGAAKENKIAARKAFIKTLCDQRKIGAPQVNDFEAFVGVADGTDLSVMSDAQYERWVATWTGAPALAGLSVVTGEQEGNDNPGGRPGVDPEKLNELDTAKAIVKQHKMSNMSKDQIEKTPSWAKLVASGFDPNTL